MNESYVRGFMSKCAEYGISRHMAASLLKKADYIDDLAEYASEHPIIGGGIAGASVPIKGSTLSGQDIGEESGGALSRPVASVIGPVGGSVASSSGGDYGKWRDSTADYVRDIGAGLGYLGGSSLGSSLGIVSSPIGASVGSYLGIGDNRRNMWANARQAEIDAISRQKDVISTRLALDMLGLRDGKSRVYGWDRVEDEERLRTLRERLERLASERATTGAHLQDDMSYHEDRIEDIERRQKFDAYGKDRDSDLEDYKSKQRDIQQKKDRIDREKGRNTDWHSVLDWKPRVFNY